MDDYKMNQLAEDVHLVTAPVRIAAEWIKILLFIALLPFVLVVSSFDRTPRPGARPFRHGKASRFVREDRGDP